MTPSFAAGFWRLADPKISLASFAGLFLGACAAAHEGPLQWGWLAVTVAGIFSIEVAKNASGEIVDFDSGADLGVAPQDRSPFSGGKRVLVDGLLTRGQTAAIAAAGYALGIAIGLSIVLFREPKVLALGIAGVALAFFYHWPPLQLSYRGLGELAVAISYGPLIVCGTYLVQRGHVPAGIVWLSVPLGLLVAAFLWINEFPDAPADAAAHKRTLVVRVGRRKASLLFGALLAASFAILALLPTLGVPHGVWLGGVALLPGIGAARGLQLQPETTSAVVPAQARTLWTFLLLAAGAGLGMLMGFL